VSQQLRDKAAYIDRDLWDDWQIIELKLELLLLLTCFAKMERVIVREYYGYWVD